MKEYNYARGGNPTRSVLEKCIAALDNADYCLTFSSGCGALSAVLHTLKPGDHIICAKETYGGTRVLFLLHTESQNMEIDFVDVTCVKSIEKAIKSNTKVKEKLFSTYLLSYKKRYF